MIFFKQAQEFQPQLRKTQITPIIRAQSLQQNQIPEPVFPNTTRIYENLDYGPYPTTTPNYQHLYDINQFLEHLT